MSFIRCGSRLKKWLRLLNHVKIVVGLRNKGNAMEMLAGFDKLTIDDWRSTSVVIDCTKTIHLKKPTDSTKLAAGLQKPGQDIWDWLGVVKAQNVS